MDTTKLFENCTGFLRARTYETCRRFGIVHQFDDVFQEASVALLEILPGYDPKKGTLLAYAWTALPRRLAKIAARLRSTHEDIDDWSVGHRDERLDIIEFRAGLDASELFLVDEALTYQHKNKSALVNYMRGYGWSRYKTLKVCESIHRKMV